MENIKAIISQYVGAWNKETPEAIKAELLQCCSRHLTYTDRTTPLFRGIDELVKLIMSSWEKFPGRSFLIVTEPEYFNGVCYYTWGVDLPGVGELAGRDFIEFDDQGRIARIVGFLPV